MRIEHWQLLLSLAAMVLQFAVAATLACRGFFRAWPSLTLSLALDGISSLVLLWFLRPGHYAAYFYTYWLTSAAQSLLHLWVAVDIVRSFRSVEYLPTSIYWGTAILGGVTAVSAASLSWRVHWDPHHLAQSVLLLNRTVNIGCGIFILFLIAGIRLAGVGWALNGLAVAIGLTVHTATALLVSEALTHRTQLFVLGAHAAEATVEIAILTYWLTFFAKSEQNSATLPAQS